MGGGGANSASLSLVTGTLDLNGSPNQAADAATTRTDGRFSKLRYALSRQQVITSTTSAFASLAGQFANKNLDSSEKFYLGGASGVRAYPASEGGGANGWLADLELRRQLPLGFNIAGFYDHGHVTVNRNNDFAGAPALNAFSLRGAGVSLGWLSAKGANAKLTLARRIDSNPNRTVTGNDQDGTLLKNRVWFTANLPI
jgi:hemolysin activation/secretion protein